MLAAIAAASALSPAALAQSSYRYWGYWQATTGRWVFAQQGPATSVPPDGSVEGWRFGVSGASAGLTPRAAAASAFAIACRDIKPRAGTKRVAVVVDPGLAVQAPPGEQPFASAVRCAQVPTDASGYDVLRAVTEVRIGNGLVCGIGGYPRSECAVAINAGTASSNAGTRTSVSGSEQQAMPRPGDTGVSGGSWRATAFVVAIIAALAVWMAAKRVRRSPR